MVHILSNYQLSHEMTKIPKLLLSSSLQSFLSQLIKEYVFLNRLYDITWFGQFTLYKPWRVLWKAYSIYCSKPSYTSITCSKIEHIPYNLIFTTKCNDSSILITITSWDFEFVVSEWICRRRHNTNPVIKYNQCCSRWISQSDCSIHIKLNYYRIEKFLFYHQWNQIYLYASEVSSLW
jgi:hypothetical protein